MAKSFKQMARKDADAYIIVDALNLAFRYKHSKKPNFAEDYLRTVQSLANSYKASNVLITADWGSSSYRCGILPEYKGNRKDKYEQQTEQEAEEFRLFMEDYEKTLELLAIHYPVFRYKNVEADDIAAQLVAELPDSTIWLISSDRDWDLLISDNVNRFSYVTRKEITKDNWSDHYDVSIDDYISYKCLTGDAGDNVPGVKGVGPKRAIGLIEQYGSAFDIADQLPIDSKYKYIESLNDFGAENLLKNYELMDLVTYCYEAIGEENVEDMRSKLESN
ncbi:MAG: endonuclease [Candidatus Thioglobus sp.]|nr:endonuclease [Candidatus Thioglobus sp.]